MKISEVKRKVKLISWESRPHCSELIKLHSTLEYFFHSLTPARRNFFFHNVSTVFVFFFFPSSASARCSFRRISPLLGIFFFGWTREEVKSFNVDYGKRKEQILSLEVPRVFLAISYVCRCWIT